MSEHRRPRYRKSRTRNWPLVVAASTLALATIALIFFSQTSRQTAISPVAPSIVSATETGAIEPSSVPTVTPEPTAAPQPVKAEPEPEPEIPAKTGIVIAWQPSHQGDTGANGWEEYVICGDIVDRVIGKLPEYDHVKAWETGMGLTGSNNYRPQPKNQKAFDSEIAQANAADADVFISIHNDGGAPTGILGEYLPGDALGKVLCTKMVDALVAGTGLHDRGLREVRIYSLEGPHNKAKHKCLLEIGDNAADRKFLENPANRDKIAQALADGIRAAGLKP